MPAIINHAQARADIAELAGGIVAAEGLSALTIRRMAEAAGTSRAIVATYFANMPDLISATFQAVADRQALRIEAAEAAGLGLHGCVEALLPLDAMRLHDWKILVAFLGVSVTDTDLAAVARYRHDHAVPRFERLLLVEHALPRSNTLVRREARRIVNNLHGRAIDLTFQGIPERSARERRGIVDEILIGSLLEE